jgi:hypothetical protein
VSYNKSGCAEAQLSQIAIRGSSLNQTSTEGFTNVDNKMVASCAVEIDHQKPPRLSE